MHGGTAPQVRKKAQERLARARIGELLTRLDIPADDPLEGLLREVSRSATAVEILGGMVATLDDPFALLMEQPPKEVGDGSDGGDRQHWPARSLYGPNHLGDAVPHVLVKMWSEERDRHARFCKLALDAGVAERQVRLAEAQGRLLAQVVGAILDDPELGLPKTKREVARKVAARHLRALPA